MNGFLGSLFRQNASTLANGDRLSQEAEFRNRRNRINNMDQMIGAAGKEIGLLQQQKQQREERKGRRAELENIRLRERVKQLNEAMDRAEDFARHKFLESEGLCVTIAHLQTCWDTPEVQELMRSPEQMGGLMYEKRKEVEASPQRQESAKRIVEAVIKRPGNRGGDDIAR